MSGEDLPLSIPLRSIADHFNCPVCMCQLTHTATTPCGHRFCDKCIRECVDRHHKCPCCNAQVSNKQLIKDPQFDELIETINREKEKAEKAYFDNLISAAASPDSGALDIGEESEYRAHFSPLENVLKEHLKQSLVAHEHYFQELRHDLARRQEQLNMEHKEGVDGLFAQGLSREDISREVALLQEQHSQQLDKLKEDFSRCGQLLANAYDKYLSEHIPAMSILPVTVSISLLHKGIKIPDVQIRPQDSTAEVKTLVSEHMESKEGDRVVSFGDNLKFFCFSPFAKFSLYEEHRMVSDILEHGASHPDISLLPEGCRPVLEMALKPGSTIAMYGQVQLESDLPKQCFAVTFQKGQGQAMDYFSCKQCNFNWICRSCMDVCHKDHEVVPYIMNHQPTWACCYCPKKKKCVIQET